MKILSALLAVAIFATGYKSQAQSSQQVPAVLITAPGAPPQPQFTTLGLFTPAPSAPIPLSSTFNETSNIVTGLGISAGTAQGITTTLGFLNDAAPYITNGNVLFEFGGLKNGSHWGGFIDAQVPVNTNSWQLTYGVSAAYFDHTFYSASLSVSLGTTVNIPVFSQIAGPVYAFVESGPGYNFRLHEMCAQSFAGVKWSHPWGKRYTVGVSFAEGFISGVPGTFQEAAGFVTAAL